MIAIPSFCNHHFEALWHPLGCSIQYKSFLSAWVQLSLFHFSLYFPGAIPYSLESLVSHQKFKYHLLSFLWPGCALIGFEIISNPFHSSQSSSFGYVISFLDLRLLWHCLPSFLCRLAFSWKIMSVSGPPKVFPPPTNTCTFNFLPT